MAHLQFNKQDKLDKIIHWHNKIVFIQARETLKNKLSRGISQVCEKSLFHILLVRMKTSTALMKGEFDNT